MTTRPLRIFCLEDNPLIVMQIEALVEDLGDRFIGAASSFADLVQSFAQWPMDGALIDIDLADGRTGPAAAAWLRARGVPCLFMTGQDLVADEHRHLALGLITKPISAPEFSEKLQLFRGAR